MASANFINECKKYANCNRFGKLITGELALPVSGTEISITDGQDYPVKELKLSKLSTQDTTTGKNLFNINSTTLGYGDISYSTNDNILTLTATGTTGAQYVKTFVKNVDSSKTYNFSFKAKKVVKGTDGQPVITIRVYGSNDDITYTQLYVVSKDDPVQGQEYSFSQVLTGYSYYRFYIYNNRGTPVTTGEKTQYYNIQFEKGSSATSYEPYTNGPSPNPDYPQEVKVVEGYRNLLDITPIESSNGVILTKNTDGSITANGQINKSWFVISNYLTIDLEAGTYKFSIDSALSYNCRLDVKYYDNTTQNMGTITSGNTNITYTFAKKVIAYYIEFPSVTSGTNINMTIKFQLVKGNQLLPYVPYGTNWIYEKTLNKNLFNKALIPSNRAYNNGLALTKASSRTADVYLPKTYPAGTYTISYGVIEDVHTLDEYFNVEVLNNTTTVKAYTVLNNTGATITINGAFNRLYFYLSNNETSEAKITIDNIQLEEGSTKTSFILYEERISTIPLNDNEICGIGNYKDELIVDKNGHCWLDKKIGKIILNGTEDWVNESTASYSRFRVPLSNAYTASVRMICFSDYFKFSTGNTTGTCFTYVGQLYLYPDISVTTTDVWKNWLSTHTPVVYYILATPQLIDLNYNVNIELFEGINYISNSENADMSLNYYKLLELNQDNNLSEFSIDSGCYVDGNIIGSIYSKKLTAQLLNAINYDIENMNIKASVGATYIDNNNEITEYINLGKYIVEKPKDEQVENYTSLVAYDYLINNLDEIYQTELDYENETITIADVYEELCSHLKLTPKTTTFTNSTIEVSANPFVNGEKNRFVLESIEKTSCTFADIDVDNNTIDLVWLSNTLDYTFTNKDDYSSLDGGKTVYGPINTLIIGNNVVGAENVSISDDESIFQNGEHQLIIREDYFLYNAELRQQAIENIWNKVNGLTYVDCKLTTLTGKPFLKIGNKIRIYIDNNEYFDTYVLKHQFKYDGTFQSIIESPCLTEQEEQVKQDVSLQEKLRDTQIIINKQAGTLENITTRTQNLENEDKLIYKKFNGYVPNDESYQTLTTSVRELQTDTYKKTEVKQILKGEFYDENNNQIVSEIVKTTSGTFDENGMLYEKTGSPVKTRINDVGTRTSTTDGDKTILFAGYVDNNNTEYADYKGQTIVATENVIVKNYFVMPEAHSRIEKYGNGGGMFYV